MLWEASVLDPNEVLFTPSDNIINTECYLVGHPLPRPQYSRLPESPTTGSGGKEIIAESMLWLLLTGRVPTSAQTLQLSRQLAEKGDLPHFVEELVDS
jgi:Citrate synthase